MLWVNKVGPYNNPQETYNYYSLPYCKPGKADAHHKWGGLGEVLQGNELIDSQIEIKFQKTIEKETICSFELDAEKTIIFRDAVAKLFWFEFFMDDLPLWGMHFHSLPLVVFFRCLASMYGLWKNVSVKLCHQWCGYKH
jgi:transmembrane 9 superfamily protein 3